MAMVTRQSFCWLTLALGLAGWTPAGGALPPAPVATGQYRVSCWTSEQGLPQNTVNCVLQTRDGYLWGGTRYGLVRFDGLGFTAFANELGDLAPEALDVQSLAEGAEGRLWLQSGTTLACLDRGRFTRLTLPAAPLSGTLQKICASRAGGLWVARTDGVLHLEAGRVTQTFHLRDDVHGLPGAVDDLREDAQGRLWLRVHLPPSNWWWLRLDPHTGATVNLTNVVGLAADDLGGLLEDGAGRLWLGRPGELLCWADGELTRFPATNAWGVQPVKCLAGDTEGNVWIATEGPVQLHRFDGRQFSHFDRAAGLSNPDDVRCLFPDREGNVWVGTGSGGLARVQPRPLVALLTGSYSTEEEVYSAAPGGEGRVWLATPYGLVRYLNGEFEVFTNTAARQPDGYTLRTRMVLEDRAGTVWAGLDRGLWTLRDGVFDQVKLPPLDGHGRRLVTSLLEDGQGTLWVGTPCGLLERRHGQFKLWTTNDGLSDSHVFGLVEGPDGSIWAGTERGGVNQLREGRFRAWTPREGLLRREAWPLRAEPDGTVWVGTPRGLNRIRGSEVRSVTAREGLYDNLAYCLLADGQGCYWSYGNRGIWRVSRTDLEAVADGRQALLSCVSYGEDDGMASAEGNGDEQPNAAAMPNGELWFPTTRGVAIFDPAKLRDNEVPPGVVIEEVRVDDETVFKDGVAGGNSEVRNPKPKNRKPDLPPVAWQAPAPIRLPPGRARVLEIRYTATTFVDAEQARFRYRLEGHEQEWQEARTRRVALYTSLRPGNYRFCVAACNRHGCWSRAPAQFAFYRAPHFYQTWLFYGLCLAFVAVSGGLIQAWRLRLQRRILHLEHLHALDTERARIAHDIHDDLGSRLSQLSVLGELAGRDVEAAAPVQPHLEQLRATTGEAFQALDEIVWAVNPKQDSVAGLMAYLREFGPEFLSPVGIRCRLDFPSPAPDVPLDSEKRHHLFLVVKEALNNVVKHARATEVWLRLSLKDKSLSLTIEDNGHGFAFPQPSTLNPLPPGMGNGLPNMRERLARLGGQFTLHSNPGQGTSIELTLPL
jgi:signal transduction histidine kinase/ligand-binding sensor domain-containing protein